MSVLKENKHAPYSKTFYQILRGVNVKATNNCSSGSALKNHNELTGALKSLSRSKILTLEIVTL